MDNGSNALLGLVLGGLVVFVILVFAFGWNPGTRTADVKIEVPKINTPAK